MKLIDVSVPLDAQLPTYPHNTPFSVEPIKRLARGDSSNVSTLHMSAHTGTHVDAPRHFFDEGAGTETADADIAVIEGVMGRFYEVTVMQAMRRPAASERHRGGRAIWQVRSIAGSASRQPRGGQSCPWPQGQASRRPASSPSW